MSLFKPKNIVFDRFIILISLIALAANILWPNVAPVQAQAISSVLFNHGDDGVFLVESDVFALPLSVSPDKESAKIKVKKTLYITVTAYSSTADQTDDTPCITASGFDVCEQNKENVIAANFLPIGAKVRLPDYAGDRIFSIQDRMHPRFSNRADIWMQTRERAKDFGIQKLKMEIL